MFEGAKNIELFIHKVVIVPMSRMLSSGKSAVKKTEMLIDFF